MPLTDLDTQISAKTLSLDSLVDGGNTAELVDVIDESAPDEALRLRNKLLRESPDLSDNVMQEATFAEDVLPSLMLTQVLEQNPQAAKSEVVKTALELRENQLPDYLLARIDSGLTHLSPKENIELEISDLKSKRTDVFNAKLQKLMTDSIQPDNLIALNINEKGLTARYRLMSAYAATGDVQNAENVFSAIPVDFQLSENEQIEYNLMSQFTALQFGMMSENKTWFSLLPEQKSTLETLAENGKSLAGIQSRAVLSLVYGTVYDDEIEIPTVENNKNAQPKPLVNEHFTAYPSHACDWFIVDYALNESEAAKDVEIALFDTKNTKVLNFEVKNRQDQLLAECGDLKAGSYYLRKTVNNILSAEIRIEIGKQENLTNIKEFYFSEDTEKTIFALFPNPATTSVSVVWKINNPGKSEIQLQITDISGKCVRTEIFNDKQGIKNLSISDLPKSIYSVSLVVDGKVLKNEKLIVN